MATQSRKWLITINNPVENSYNHTVIKENLHKFKNLVYYCMCDEVGDESKTYHTHVFFVLKSPAPWDRVNKHFPNFHRDIVYGKSSENRAYILKDGEKFNKDKSGKYRYEDASGHVHTGINYSDTFEEDGEIPDEHQGKSKDYEKIVQMIKDGADDASIVDEVPSAYSKIEDIQRVRSLYRDSEFKNKWRDLEVTYIFGATGTGKTRSVMEKYGYQNVYRVTDYKHPFDTYDGQDVILFEEFRSSLKHGDMLNYLDGYPILLPCRYFNRQACYTKVYIISNIEPTEQYLGVDEASRKAFFRRIGSVIEFQRVGFYIQYAGVTAWQKRDNGESQLPLEFI